MLITNKKPTGKTGKPVKPNRSVNKQYRDRLLHMTDILKQQTALILSVHGEDDISSALDELQSQSEQAQKSFDNAADPIATSFVSEANAANKTGIDLMLTRSIGIPFADIIDSENIKKSLALATTTNVGLIKSLPTQHFSKVLNAINDSFKGLLEGSLSKTLLSLGAETDRRAKFIARDQTAKMNSSLTEIRHKDIGIEEYNWKNSQDERVVGNPSGLYPKGNKGHGNHWDRENKRYSYADPPADGNPGNAFNCRCTAAPIIDVDKLNLNFLTK